MEHNSKHCILCAAFILKRMNRHRTKKYYIIHIIILCLITYQNVSFSSFLFLTVNIKNDQSFIIMWVIFPDLYSFFFMRKHSFYLTQKCNERRIYPIYVFAAVGVTLKKNYDKVFMLEHISMLHFADKCNMHLRKWTHKTICFLFY